MCNMSAQSASTYQDSEKIKSLKERKILHYRPSLELNEGEKACYYANIVANTANHNADRIMKRVNDTLQRIEEMQAKNKNLMNAS